jgi:hypothetical protein
MVGLLRKLCAQPCKLGVADGSRLLQPIEFFDLVGNTETNNAPEIIARLLDLLHVALSHASSLKDQIRKYAKVGKHDPGYYPERLDPAGNIVSPEQIGGNGDQQPEPHDEDKYRERVDQKISIGEPFLNEEHRLPPFRYDRIDRLSACNVRLRAKNSEQSLISIKVGGGRKRYGEYCLRPTGRQDTEQLTE